MSASVRPPESASFPSERDPRIETSARGSLVAEERSCSRPPARGSTRHPEARCWLVGARPQRSLISRDMRVIGAGYCEGCRAVYPVLSGEALICRCLSCRGELVDAPAELTGFEEESWAPSTYPSREGQPTEAGEFDRHQLSLVARPSVVVEYDPDAYGIEDGSVRRGLFIARPAHQPRHLAGLGLSEVGALRGIGETPFTLQIATFSGLPFWALPHRSGDSTPSGNPQLPSVGIWRSVGLS